MERDGNTYRGTRAEVLAALENDIIYQERFGTERKAHQAEIAFTCVMGGSPRVSVGTLTYEVTPDGGVA